MRNNENLNTIEAVRKERKGKRSLSKKTKKTKKTNKKKNPTQNRQKLAMEQKSGVCQGKGPRPL